MDMEGEGAARAQGTGLREYGLGKTGRGAAVAAGAGVPSATASMTSDVGVMAMGRGLLDTEPKPPRITDSLIDAWVYGSAREKDMVGTGRARAQGTGVST